jgi:AcrR family transcriptional regulator
MAYEVIKTIGTRQYRYRVQSERDPQTAKVRNRWTYVGRVEDGRDASKSRTPRNNARLRLIEATETLLESGDASALTIDAITAAAGVAHGTFYRYFRDRVQLLAELANHINATRLGEDQQLDDAVTRLEDARRGVRRWVIDKLDYARTHPSSARAWYTLIATEPRLAAFRENRRDERVARLATHIDALVAAGWSDVADAHATAFALAVLVEGVSRASIVERDGLDDAAIRATADIVERAIFTRG